MHACRQAAGRREAPGPVACDGRRSQQAGAIEDPDRRTGFAGTRQRWQRIVRRRAAGQRALDAADVVGRTANRRGVGRLGVDGDGVVPARRTRVTCGIRRSCREAAQAVSQRGGRRETPVPAGIGLRAAEQRGAVVEFERCVGFRRAANQRQRIVGLAATGQRALNAADVVGRAGNRRNGRRRRVDDDTGRRRQAYVAPRRIAQLRTHRQRRPIWQGRGGDVELLGIDISLGKRMQLQHAVDRDGENIAGARYGRQAHPDIVAGGVIELGRVDELVAVHVIRKNQRWCRIND